LRAIDEPKTCECRSGQCCGLPEHNDCGSGPTPDERKDAGSAKNGSRSRDEVDEIKSAQSAKDCGCKCKQAVCEKGRSGESEDRDSNGAVLGRKMQTVAEWQAECGDDYAPNKPDKEKQGSGRLDELPGFVLCVASKGLGCLACYGHAKAKIEEAGGAYDGEGGNPYSVRVRS